MTGIIALVASFSDRIDDGRTREDVLRYLDDEVVELRDEIVATTPGPDGIFGESVDVMINCIDMMRMEYPDLSLDELEAKVLAYARLKCEKWEAKYGKPVVKERRRPRDRVAKRISFRLRRRGGA